jgi:predicted DNA binding protein
MSVVAEFTVPTDSFRTGRILNVVPEYSLRVVEFVSNGNSVLPYFWVESREQGFARFEERVRSDEHVAALTALDSHANQILYRIEWATEADWLLAAFDEFDLSVEAATAGADEWVFRVFCETHEVLASFREYCDARDNPLSIGRVYNPSPPDEDPACGLTAEQQAAIRLAFDEGYFEIPREATMTELGEDLGISRQAVSNRLRRGLTQLVEQTIDGYE